MSARRLLFVHYDDRLLSSHSAVLRQAGYRVEGAKNLLGALRWLSYDTFDLIVLGDNVLRSQLQLALERIHECTHIPVVLNYRGEMPPGINVDAAVRVEDGDKALVSVIDQMLLNAPDHSSQRPDPSGTLLR